MQSTPPCADYLITGEWSLKAYKEAARLLQANQVLDPLDAYTTVPSADTWTLSADAAYLYYCANETIHGVEYQSAPVCDVPLVADMSSNILSRAVNVRQHAVIFAGTQKNIGAAGLTVAVVRKDLMTQTKAHKTCPSVLNYETIAKADSVYNTPPVYG